MPMWVMAVAVIAATALSALTVRAAFDPTGRAPLMLGLATILVLSVAESLRSALPAQWRGPWWVVWAVPVAFDVAALAVWLRPPRRPSPPPWPSAGICARCLRVLYDDGSGRERYLDRAGGGYLCPPEVRDPAHRRHTIVRV